MSLRALLFFGCLALPGLASAGALEVLSAEIAQEAARQISKARQEVSACVYVDDSLSPNSGSLSLAQAVAAALSSQYGVRDVFNVGVSSLSEAPNLARDAGCGVAVVIALEAPGKGSRSRIWVLRPSSRSFTFYPSHPHLSALGEPFLSSMLQLPVIAQTPVDLSKGWQMQQISIGSSPFIALVTGALRLQEGDISSLFALSKNAVVSYRFAPRAKSTSPFSPPKELYRAELSSLPKALRVSRDLTGVLTFDRTRCSGDCSKEVKSLLLRTSSLSSSYRISLDESFSTPQALSPDEELSKLWPLFVSDEQAILFGALEEGSNLFTKKVWWVEPSELNKKRANKTEIEIGARFFAASYAADKEQRAAFVQESEDLMLYQLTGLTPAGSLGKAGAQLLLVDLDGDGAVEVISTNSDAPGEGDTITISAIEDKIAGRPSQRKLWSSGTLYAPASTSTGKTRPLSWVTALAAGDLDGDGIIEVIAALYSPAGSSILVISR
jgi:hypothetical protein